MRTRLSNARAMVLGTNVVSFALQLLMHGAPAHTPMLAAHTNAQAAYSTQRCLSYAITN